MKLTWYDRLVALAFNPQYCGEFKELFPMGSASLDVLFSPDRKLEKFKKRWGLEFVVNPDHLRRRIGIDLRKDMEGGAFRDYVEMVKVIPHDETLQGDRLDLSRVLRVGKYLTVQLDITADQTKLFKHLREYLKFYRKLVKFQPAGRAKPSGLDHWVVYKQYLEGKSLYKIAQEISGIHGSLSQNDKDISEKVTRAFKKADKMVNQASPK